MRYSCYFKIKLHHIDLKYPPNMQFYITLIMGIHSIIQQIFVEYLLCMFATLPETWETMIIKAGMFSAVLVC